MQSTLTIKDLSVQHDIDAADMATVRGGLGDQANGTSQMNVQNMAAVANVGNGSLFCGPATIQSDNTFTQSASNFSDAENFKALSLGFGPVLTRTLAG